ncbi:MAG: hypothetical protein WBM40_05350 [Thiohalocapsa sp.]
MSEPVVSIEIDGKEWKHWTQVELKRSVDNFSTFRFTAPFDASKPEFRKTFRPFSFQPVTIKLDGQGFFSGTLVSVEPKSTAKSTSVIAAGYALPAVLADSTMPASSFPIEYGDHTLRQIAEALAAPFGIRVKIGDDTTDGPQFRRAAIKPTQKIGDFLGKLARARGMVMGDNAQGDLEFRVSARPGRPVVRFKEGEAPATSVAATFSPQSYYSEITGLGRTKAGFRGSKYTEKNPHLPRAVRPLNFTVGDVNAGDLPGATKAKMARMFGNMVAYVVQVPTWFDANGVVWEPNTTVTLTWPGVMVYSETDLLLRDVTIRADENSTTASLGLMLPGAFSSETPRRLPWD